MTPTIFSCPGIPWHPSLGFQAQTVPSQSQMTLVIFSLVFASVTWVPGSDCFRKCGYSVSALAEKRRMESRHEQGDEDERMESSHEQGDEDERMESSHEQGDEDEINRLPESDRHKEVMLFGIVGGSEAGLGKFPWMVSLQVRQGGKLWQHVCGGSLLAPDWILTAGHCKPQMLHRSVRAVAGCQEWRTNGEFDCQVSEFDALVDMTNHEEFDLSTFNNDISLIHLKKPFRSSTFNNDVSLTHLKKPFMSSTFNNDVSLTHPKKPFSLTHPKEPFMSSTFNNDVSLTHPKKPFMSYMQHPVSNICIPPEGTVYSGTATVAGWGNLSYKGRMAESLMMVDVRILRPTDCARYPNFRPGPQLCAGFVQGAKDACSGDSGGPLMMSIGPHTYQIAIVSSGRDCAKAGYPGIYTDVASYRSWIQSKSGLRLN